MRSILGSFIVAILLLVAVTCGGPDEQRPDGTEAPGAEAGARGGSSSTGGTTQNSGGKGGASQTGTGGTSIAGNAGASQAGAGGTGTGGTSTAPDAGALIDAPAPMDAGAQAGIGGSTKVDASVVVDAGLPPPDAEIVQDPQLVAYYRLDDAVGAAGRPAQDSSLTGSAGLYTGMTSGPALVPGPAKIKFPNAGAARFTSAQHQAVLVAPAPLALRPAKNITVSAWYRTLSSTEAELFSMGDSYAVRIQGQDVVFIKRVPETWEICTATAATNDGNWHHVAVAQNDSAMFIFIDGALAATCGQAAPITYDLGMEFVIGRHGTSVGRAQFEGDIDDVRIYNAVLSPERIASLASGNAE